ncbi:hypothetical protein OZX74_02075 [Bifidobacterium sp. ESL0798]|uniref:hypothetical protein n=1 Tax=Bifidobacterium sp. ESL0798 TaxID=2983235 RepID=UPI0023FA46A4|nr:hypothetical protein [Bifidobacterium sp. ESL0798]WEV74360.1 hypothetical protein OZX74_02075 [Bifidobacterium sp. ESL0798]
MNKDEIEKKNREIEELFGYTPEQLDEMAEPYENGTWRGIAGPVIIGSPSYPEVRRQMAEVERKFGVKPKVSVNI